MLQLNDEIYIDPSQITCHVSDDLGLNMLPEYTTIYRGLTYHVDITDHMLNYANKERDRDIWLVCSSNDILVAKGHSMKFASAPYVSIGAENYIG